MVELLLRAGARTDIQNKLGKMAANVAAFVGMGLPLPLPFSSHGVYVPSLNDFCL